MGRRYRQLFLFLAVLILPSVLIAVQGRRLYVQERELAKGRLEEARKRTAEEIGQDMVTRLERIRTREMVNAPAAPTRRDRSSDPAIVAVGWVDGERLVWPWDVSPGGSEKSEGDPAFAAAMQTGRRAEFTDQRYDRAADLYRQAARIARDETERGSALLSLARSERRLGRRAAAAAVYRDVLKLPSMVTDNDGLSLWSYAAAPLVELGVGIDVLERANRDMDSPAVWPLVQMYRFRTILEALRDSRDQAAQEGARSALDRLTARLNEGENAERLQGDFSKLRLSSTVWLTYKGSDLWLVGRSPEGVTTKPLVLVVNAEAIRQAIESDRLSRGDGPRFQVAADGPGESLSEYAPDLRINFPEGVADGGAEVSPQRSLWGLSFTLVALLTLLGAYLLWRDMRREAHVAELRTQFVSSVSHELKTPLTSIRMFAELLQMRDANDLQQTRFLDTIVSESERLTRLLNNVLDFSRIERGQKTYRLEPAPLADVVQDAVRTIQYPLTQQGFSVDLTVCEGIPAVAVDRDAIQQAILNLLTNAMKYSGGHREIAVRVSAENGTAVIQVSDRGIGIPEKEQSLIFEKFYRVPSPENSEIPGTGLGLPLVAHIAEGHGGTVQVKSRPGEGSTFSIVLPLNAGGAA